MTFYAALSGNDIVSHRKKLNATTLTGAKREATRTMGGGFRHHQLVVGVLVNEGTHYEYGEPRASRYLSERRWRKDGPNP